MTHLTLVIQSLTVEVSRQKTEYFSSFTTKNTKNYWQSGTIERYLSWWNTTEWFKEEVNVNTDASYW